MVVLCHTAIRLGGIDVRIDQGVPKVTHRYTRELPKQLEQESVTGDVIG